MLKNLLAVADMPEDVVPNTGGTITNPAVGNLGTNQGVNFLKSALPAAVEIGLIIGVLVFFFILLTGAIQWIASGGDKQSLEGARGKITNAIIGLVILFSIFAIIQLIQNFFHISILNITLPSLTGQK
jgi:hypothetical protein